MKPLIVALDVETEKEALSLIKATRNYVDLYKIGPGLFLRYGPDILKKIRKTGKKIFLDLKFHDIPNTMLHAVKETSQYSIFSITVHTSAGENALRAVSEISRRPLLWGVTVLTSLTHQDLITLGFRNSTVEQVSQLGQLAKRTKLDGVVASVGEAATLRILLGPHVQIITPGIRMAGNDVGDQQRIATPSHARAAGADFMVVGRPIIEADDPEELADLMLKDWKKGEK